jgi:hypothetical protein
MAVTTDKPAPYAPPSTVIEVIKRYRERGLQTPITKDVLLRAGIAETLTPRVLQTIQTLDLIDEAGNPTETFEDIRKAPQGEYKDRLVQWLNGVYADALNFIDPATSDETAIRDAFRSYEPVGQQPRMVALFIGLYAEAGLGPERASAPRTTTAPRVSVPKRNIRGITKSGPRAGLERSATIQSDQTGTLPAPITGMLARLPKRSWTKDERSKFLATFTAVLDFCYPVVEQSEQDDEAEAAE